MIERTIVLNPIEPAFLSMRAALGVPLDLTLTFLKQDQQPADPTQLMPQLALLPRSALMVFAYEFTTLLRAGGTATLSIPGTALIDPAGYNLELYQRQPGVAPGDPPVPVGMLAKGVLRLEGSAYVQWGPLAPLAVPVVVGPPGPPGPVGPMGITGPVGPVGDPGSVWYTGDQFPMISMPGGGGANPGDMYLKNIDPNGGSVWTWTGSVWTYTGADISGPQGDPGPVNVLTIGTVTTGAPGSPAEVHLSGTSPNQVISFVIPQGLTGAVGPQGATGANVTLGTVLPGSAVDGALFWNTTNNQLFVREAGTWVIVDAVWGV